MSAKSNLFVPLKIGRKTTNSINIVGKNDGSLIVSVISEEKNDSLNPTISR
jgi:hypothetical protein